MSYWNKQIVVSDVRTRFDYTRHGVGDFYLCDTIDDIFCQIGTSVEVCVVRCADDRANGTGTPVMLFSICQISVCIEDCFDFRFSRAIFEGGNRGGWRSVSSPGFCGCSK